MWRTLACCALLAALAGASQGQQTMESQPQPTGWETRYIGPLRGDASVSIGAQFWDHYFHIRNLIARASLDLAPGLRAHVIARRKEGRWDRMPFQPDLDEAYLEGMAFYHASTSDLAFDLKVGRNRYLRFPEPDYLSLFDQVPGIGDFYGGPETDYHGALFTVDAADRSGFGVHFDGIAWGFGPYRDGVNAIEDYAFFRHGLGGGWAFEARGGGLAQRVQPLGLPARLGVDGYLGKQIGEFNVGVMVEKLRGYTTYTGLMVRFRPSDITRFLGKIGFDYARNPEGAAVQVDLLHARINEGRQANYTEELVGEVHAVRVRTFWQQSYQRNEYEHRLSSWGVTSGPGVRCVVEETPWRLDLEALVSPHTTPDAAWLRDRQGPAQLAQDVVYRFYREKP